MEVDLGFVESSQPTGPFLVTSLISILSSKELLELQRKFAVKGAMTLEDFGNALEQSREAVARAEKRAMEPISRLVDLYELFDQLDGDDDGFITWDDFSTSVLDSSLIHKAPLPFNSKPNVVSMPSRKAQLDDLEASDNMVYLPGLKKVALCSKMEPFCTLWGPQDGKISFFPKRMVDSGVICVVHIPCLRAIVSSNDDRTLALWEELPPHAKRSTVQCDQIQLCLCWDEMHMQLASGGTDGKITLYDKNFSVVNSWKAHGSWVMDIITVRDIGMLVSASLDKQIKFWDAKTTKCKTSKVGHTTGIVSLAYAKGFRLLASAGFNRDVYIWNMFAREPIAHLRMHDRALVSVCISERFPHLISTDVTGKVCVWDLQNLRHLQTIQIPDTHVTSAVLDPENDSIVVSAQKNIHIIQKAKVSTPGTLSSRVRFILYNDAFRVITCFYRNVMQSWDARSGKPHAVQHDLTQNEADVTAVALCGNQRLVCIGDLEGYFSVIGFVSANVIHRIQIFQDEIVRIIPLEGSEISPSEILKSLKSIRKVSAQATNIVDHKGLRCALAFSHSGGMSIVFWGNQGNDTLASVTLPSLKTEYMTKDSLDVDIDSLTVFFSRVSVRHKRRKSSMDADGSSPIPSTARPKHEEGEEESLTILDLLPGTVRKERRVPYHIERILLLPSIKVFAVSSKSSSFIDFFQMHSLYPLVRVNLGKGVRSISHMSFLRRAQEVVLATNKSLCRVNLRMVALAFNSHSGGTRSLLGVDDSQLFRGRYVIDRGKKHSVLGGLNEVRFAYDIKLERKVALKFTDDKEEYETEVKVLSQVESDHILEIYDHGNDPLFIAMELGNISLHDEIQSCPNEGLSELEAKRLAVHLARGLQSLQSISHISSDIKPKNVMRFGDIFKIIDLDNSRVFGSVMTKKYTPQYCPPEMAKAALLLSHDRLIASASYDMWGYGLVVYETCTGHPLMKGTSEETLLDQLSCLRDEDIDVSPIKDPVLQAIVKECLRTDPSKRWSVTRVLEELHIQEYDRAVSMPPEAPIHFVRDFKMERLDDLITIDEESAGPMTPQLIINAEKNNQIFRLISSLEGECSVQGKLTSMIAIPRPRATMCAMHFPDLSQSCLFTTSLDGEKDVPVRLLGILPVTYTKYIEGITGIEQIPKEMWNFPVAEGRHIWNPQSALKSLHGLIVLSKMSKAAKEKVMSRKQRTSEESCTTEGHVIDVQATDSRSPLEDGHGLELVVSESDAKKNDLSFPKVGKSPILDVQHLSPFFSEWKDGNGKSEPVRPFFLPPKAGRRGSSMEKDIHLVLKELKKRPRGKLSKSSTSKDKLPPIDGTPSTSLGKEKDPNFIFRTPRTSLLQSIVPSPKMDSKSYDMSRKQQHQYHRLHRNHTASSLPGAPKPHVLSSSDSDTTHSIHHWNTRSRSPFRRMLLARESPQKAIDEAEEKMEFDRLCSMDHKESPVKKKK